MYANGYPVGDGSWDLKIYITNLRIERTIRVTGDLHIGGLVLNLTNELGKLTDQATRHLHLWTQLVERRRPTAAAVVAVAAAPCQPTPFNWL